jgi:hypothetical protein
VALSNTDQNTLEEIVATAGQCMDSKRCQRCPFKALCLPEFLNPVPPSQPQRLKMAEDVLTHHYLLDGDIDVKDYKWDKN